MALVTRTSLALERSHRDLPNRVKASFTRVGNSADSRGLAQCCATMCSTLPHGIEFSESRSLGRLTDRRSAAGRALGRFSNQEDRDARPVRWNGWLSRLS
jgi:hypothetical protein